MRIIMIISIDKLVSLVHIWLILYSHKLIFNLFFISRFLPGIRTYASTHIQIPEIHLISTRKSRI